MLIEAEMWLEEREPGRGHQTIALLASERARARGLVDLLHQARQRITAGVDAQLLARERQLATEVAQADERLTRLLSARVKTDGVQAAEREVDGLATELRDVQRDLRIRSPQYAALTQPTPLDVTDIQRLLDPDSVLVEYSLGTVRSYAWVVTPDQVTSVVLSGRGEIEEAARRAYDLLERGARRDTRVQTRRALESLADLVLTPVAPLLGKRRVIVVPDAGLHYVPFAALPKPGASGALRPRALDRGSRSRRAAVGGDARRPAAGRASRRRHRPRSGGVCGSGSAIRRRAAGAPAARATPSPLQAPPRRRPMTDVSSGCRTRARKPRRFTALAGSDRTLTALDFSASRDTGARRARTLAPHPLRHACAARQQSPGTVPKHHAVARESPARRAFPPLPAVYLLKPPPLSCISRPVRAGFPSAPSSASKLCRLFFYSFSPGVLAVSVSR